MVSGPVSLLPAPVRPLPTDTRLRVATGILLCRPFGPAVHRLRHLRDAADGGRQRLPAHRGRPAPLWWTEDADLPQLLFQGDLLADVEQGKLRPREGGHRSTQRV